MTRVQMLWKKQKCLLLMVMLLLGCSALCLETARKGKLVQAGKLIIGTSSYTSKDKDDIGQKVYNEYAQDSQGSQSDQPELMGGSQLASLVLRSWSPSVWCDNESMTLRLQGSRLPVFLVETRNEDPVPLLRIPSHCGFSVRRARRDISLVAKYDGCNVVQQGDAYILPLYVLGVVVKMVCPADRPLTMVSCSPSAMVVNLGLPPDAVRLKVNGVWEPVNQASTTCGFTAEVVGGGLTLTAPYTSTCWRFEGTVRHLSIQYMDGEMTLSCPAVQHFPPTPPPQHDYMGYPFYGYGMPRYVHHGQPETLSVTTASTTTAKTHTTKATIVAHNGVKQPVGYPWLFGRYNAYALPWYVHPGQPGTLLNPTTTTASSSVKTHTTQATVVAHDSANQQFWNSWLPGRYNAYAIPRYVHHGQFGTLSNAPTTTPSTTMTKTPANRVSPTVANQLWYPWLQGMCKTSGYGIPWYFHHGQAAAPVGAHTATTTSATTVAPIDAYPPLLYPWVPGIKNDNTHVGSTGVPVSGSAVKHQYPVPWMNALQVPSGLGSKSNAKLFSG